MCLGIPGQIVKIDGKVAQVDFWGTTKPVRLDTLETAVLPGDYIIDHAGYAIRRVEPEDVADTIALYETVLSDVCDDPISIDSIAKMERTEEIEVELEFAWR